MVEGQNSRDLSGLRGEQKVPGGRFRNEGGILNLGVGLGSVGAGVD